MVGRSAVLQRWLLQAVQPVPRWSHWMWHKSCLLQEPFHILHRMISPYLGRCRGHMDKAWRHQSPTTWVLRHNLFRCRDN
eukprot:symbB.v1.2.021241.t1/scaffold1825.1/size102390/8